MILTQPRNVGNKDESDDYILDEHNKCAQTLVDIDAFDTMKVTTGSYTRKYSNGILVVEII